MHGEPGNREDPIVPLLLAVAVVGAVLLIMIAAGAILWLII